jgi:DNA-binding GntR family transcriptional regulator/predicted metal-dependent enzyme (double-stranded beta helix superfamily)
MNIPGPEPKHARPQLNKVAFERIKRDILTCALEPGRQVTEAQLAARYALGKAPIRAALAGLCQGGFVRAIPRRGYLITPITMRDVQDITQLRLLLEPPAASLAAGRLDDEDIERLRTLCEVRCSPREKSSERAVSAHRELHLIVARASGNQRLADTLAKLYDDVERLMHLGVSRVQPEEMSGYKPLVEALAVSDGDSAARLMVEQIELGRKRILEALLSGPGKAEINIREGLNKTLSLTDFAEQIQAILSGPNPSEAALRVAENLPRLLRNPRFLNPEQRESSSHSYRRHLLYVDPEGRFSVLAIVWEAGQTTPAHDHPCWSVMGVYAGELRETCYRRLNGPDGTPRLIPTGVTHYQRGDVTYLDLLGQNLHRFDNPTNDVAISVHIYGSDVRSSGSSFGQCYVPEDMAVDSV